MVYGVKTGGRKGGEYCAIVMQCNSIKGSGSPGRRVVQVANLPIQKGGEGGQD